MEGMSDGLFNLPVYISEAMEIPRSEARRLIATGQVTLGGEVVTELDVPLDSLAGKVLAVPSKPSP
jgi:16S rRNA U516 pseudouridylate synthase RsuA-like enzyme